MLVLGHLFRCWERQGQVSLDLGHADPQPVNTSPQGVLHLGQNSFLEPESFPTRKKKKKKIN